MKREVKTLLRKAEDALILSVDSFNCPWDTGRVECFLIMLDHAFEMLLKASIIHRGGKIKAKSDRNTIGFKACLDKAQHDKDGKFLHEEQALTLDAINSLRDAAQHYYLDVSEQHLYLHAQSGLTLFRDIVRDVFSRNLAAELPVRVLPIATTLPTDLITLFTNEVEEVRRLLLPGRRRRAEALSKLRSLVIVENALNGRDVIDYDAESARIARQIRNGAAAATVFSGVASIRLVAEGEGPTLSIRITKKEGLPVQLVPEGTPGAAVVAVKRVDELGFYSLSFTSLSRHTGVTTYVLNAMLWCLKLKGKPEYHKQLTLGKSSVFDRYSQKAIQAIVQALKDHDGAHYVEQWKAREK